MVAEDAASDSTAPPSFPIGGVALALLASLLIAAFWVRAIPADTVAFRLDEATTVAIAAQIATGRELPVLGLRTSFGFHNPPTIFYAAAPVAAFTVNPEAFTVAVALIAVGAIGWLAVVVGRLWGVAAMLILAALMGFAPNAVEYGRRLWGHDLVLAASAGGFALLLPALAGARGASPASWRVAAAMAMAAVAQSLHLSGALLWVPCVMALRALEPPARLRASLWGAGALLLVYAPWIAGNVASGFADVQAMLAVAAKRPALPSEPVVGPLTAWVFLLGDSLTDDRFRFIRPWEASPLPAATVAFEAAAVALLALALAAAASRLSRRSGDRLLDATLLASALAPAVAFGVVFRGSVPPYLLPAMVPMALLLVRAVAERFEARVPAAAGLVAALVLPGLLAYETARTLCREKPWLCVPTTASIRSALAPALASPDPIALLQDARSPAVGPDVALAVAWFERTGQSRMPTRVDRGTRLFVLVDPSTRLAPGLAAALRPHRIPPPRGSGYEVYSLPWPASAQFLERVRMHHAGGSGGPGGS